jgi:hypothetical protein
LNELFLIVSLYNNKESLNKIIKIQSNFRGKEMRDQIKLRNVRRKLDNKNKLSKLSDENIIGRKVVETDEEFQKNFGGIVKNIIY